MLHPPDGFESNNSGSVDSTAAVTRADASPEESSPLPPALPMSVAALSEALVAAAGCGHTRR